MLTKLLFCSIVLACAVWAADPPSADAIIQKSVAANEADFRAADGFTHDETDKVGAGTRTYSILMIEGTPYEHLIAINGEPLSQAEAAQEQRKMQDAIAARKRESPDQRRNRIEKYQAERRRNARMLNQLSVAFNFHLVGTGQLDGFSVYRLRATPKPGYRPPDMDSQVLTGMEGHLWIDQKTFHWVRVTAKVIRPVAIEGFLARVEPGTQFEIEKRPVSGSIWQITHYSMRARAKVLFVVNHNSEDDETYFNFRPLASAGSQQTSF